MAGLARDVQVSFNSIRNWLKVFESFFLIFRVPSWEKRITRAITKEKKLYLFDYANNPSEPSKFENMVALELWRAISNWNDLGLGNFKLYYIRNKEKEEVDFLIAEGSMPKLLVEAKLSDVEISKSLLKFQSLLKIPAVQLVNRPGVCRILSNHKEEALIITASRWLAALP